MDTGLLGLRIDNERVVVSSRDVARVFEKNHQHVLRDIRELGCSEEFRLSNFGRVEYVDGKGEIRPEFLLSKDGFVLLAMGYTGWKKTFATGPRSPHGYRFHPAQIARCRIRTGAARVEKQRARTAAGRGVGVELSEQSWRDGVRYLRQAEQELSAPTTALFKEE